MPKRYWGFIAAIVGIIGIVGIVGWGLAEQIAYAERAHNRSAEYAADTAKQADQSCASIAGRSQKGLCLHKAATAYRVQAREKHREYDDLIAQQSAALWTKITGVAAVVGMALSVAGVFLVYTTYTATKDSNEIARTIGEAQVRAYLSVIEAGLVLFDGNMLSANVSIKNFGQSPVKMFLWQPVFEIVRWEMSEDRLSTISRRISGEFLTEEDVWFSMDTISAGETYKSDYTSFNMWGVLTDEELVAYNSANHSLSVSVFISIRYQDVFGKWHDEKPRFDTGILKRAGPQPWKLKRGV